MRLVKKGEAPKADDTKAMAEVPSYPWDHAMQMLGTGDFDIVGDPRGERGPDQPGAQMPAPGVDPVGSKEKAEDGQVLTNMSAAGKIVDTTGDVSKSPLPPKSDVTVAPKGAAPAPALKPTA